MRRNPSSQKSTRWIATLAALAGLSSISAFQAHGQSNDALLDKLVQKGILSQEEAQNLRDESDKDFALAHSVRTGMPEWVNSLRLNGDWRARYESFFFPHNQIVPPGNTSAQPDIHRFRHQLRFGVTAVMLENFEVGFRLATSEGTGAFNDPTSINQTLQKNGSRKAINLDLAYAKWTPINSADWTATVSIGKIENPFTFSDALFDVDYTPEGAAEQVTYTLNDAQQIKFIAGQFILDWESYSSSAPYLLGEQVRWDSVWNPKWSSSLSAGYFSIQHPGMLGLTRSLTLNPNDPTQTQPTVSSTTTVPDIAAGNSRTVYLDPGTGFPLPGNSLDQPSTGFGTLALNGAVTYTRESMPFYTGPFPIKMWGELLDNLDAADQNFAWQAGIVFGKAGKQHAWEVSYRFKYEEGDAWYEELTDSDFGGFYEINPLHPLPIGVFSPTPGVTYAYRNPGVGYFQGTNAKGHIIKVAYSPYDFLTLSATLYSTTLILPYPLGSSSHVNRLLVDAMFRF